VVIDTERLHLRPCRADDLDALHALTDDKESRRFLSGVSRREDSYRRLMMTVGGWAAHGFGTFAIEDRATGVVVGSGGLFRMVRTLDVEMPEAVEAGWIIARPRWGEGLASEAMSAVHDWWDREHGPGRTIAMIVPGNTPSERIAARLGYHAFRDTEHLGDPVRLYERG
jgi:RimJ/RimL family protein N-acetyltransferase